MAQKNKQILGTKPLFYYPIKLVLDSKLFKQDEIVFSSDSKQILDEANKVGNIFSIKRDLEFINDNIGIKDVILNFLDLYPTYKKYDAIIIILPSSPFTRVKDLKNCIKIFEEDNFPTVLSMSKISNSVFQSMYFRGKTVVPNFPEFYFDKKKSEKESYHPNGCVHIIDLKSLLDKKSYLVEPIGGYKMNSINGLDIDESEDLVYANFILEKKLK